MSEAAEGAKVGQGLAVLRICRGAVAGAFDRGRLILHTHTSHTNN